MSLQTMDITVFTHDEWIVLFKEYVCFTREEAEQRYKILNEAGSTEDDLGDLDMIFNYRIALYKKQNNDEAVSFLEDFYKTYHSYQESINSDTCDDICGDMSILYSFVINNLEKVKKYYPGFLLNEREFLLLNYFNNFNKTEKNIYRMWYRELFDRDINDDFDEYMMDNYAPRGLL